MVAASHDSMVPAGPPERRPAIWPWVVMPLATLALFAALHKMTPASSWFDSGANTRASTPVESTTP